jgi:hypothetical protein
MTDIYGLNEVFIPEKHHLEGEIGKKASKDPAN